MKAVEYNNKHFQELDVPLQYELEGGSEIIGFLSDAMGQDMGTPTPWQIWCDVSNYAVGYIAGFVKGFIG